MSNEFYDVAVPAMKTKLIALKAIIEKTQNYCAESEVDESAFTGFRLFPDMHNFCRQVQSACDTARNACYRLADVEREVIDDTETTFKELQTRIDKTLAILSGFTAEQFEGWQQKSVSMDAGEMTVTFPNGLVYLHDYVLANFYFHYTTAYNMLRHNAMAIGKMDYIGPIDVEFKPKA